MSHTEIKNILNEVRRHNGRGSLAFAITRLADAIEILSEQLAAQPHQFGNAITNLNTAAVPNFPTGKMETWSILPEMATFDGVGVREMRGSHVTELPTVEDMSPEMFTIDGASVAMMEATADLAAILSETDEAELVENEEHAKKFGEELDALLDANPEVAAEYNAMISKAVERAQKQQDTIKIEEVTGEELEKHFHHDAATEVNEPAQDNVVETKTKPTKKPGPKPAAKKAPKDKSGE